MNEVLMMPRKLLASSISSPSKILYTIILYLSQSDTGSYYCCPSNAWLSQQLDCSENSITKYLKELRDNHYIRVQEDRVCVDSQFITRRVISLTKLSASDMAEMEQAYTLFHIETYDKEMATWSDADLGVDTDTEDVKISDVVINYLNTKANTNYRTSSKTHTKWIDARVKEGYTIDDFKKVIDNKCAEWLYTDMEQYLRPITLFGNKFDTYLNQHVTISEAQIEKRKLKQTQSNAVNPYQQQVSVNDPWYNQAQAISDDWFANQFGGYKC